MKSVNERIKDLREDNDLTQKAVADILHVAQRTYADYELANLRIPLDILIVLARYYNVSLDYMCGLSDIKKPFPSK